MVQCNTKSTAGGKKRINVAVAVSGQRNPNKFMIDRQNWIGSSNSKLRRVWRLSRNPTTSTPSRNFLSVHRSTIGLVGNYICRRRKKVGYELQKSPEEWWIIIIIGKKRDPSMDLIHRDPSMDLIDWTDQSILFWSSDVFQFLWLRQTHWHRFDHRHTKCRIAVEPVAHAQWMAILEGTIDLKGLIKL